MKPLKPEEFTAVPGAGAPSVADFVYGLDPNSLPLPTPVDPDAEINQPK